MRSTRQRNRLAAEVLAREMEEIMDEHFLKPSNETVQAQLRELREQIRTFGYSTVVSFTLNAVTLSLETTIALHECEMN